MFMSNVLMAVGNTQLVAYPTQALGPEFWGKLELQTRNATWFKVNNVLWLSEDGPIDRCVKVILGYNNMDSKQQCADPIKLQNAQIGLVNSLMDGGYSALKIANAMKVMLGAIPAGSNAIEQATCDGDVSLYEKYLKQTEEPKPAFVPLLKAPVEIAVEEKKDRQILIAIGVMIGLICLLIVEIEQIAPAAVQGALQGALEI
jgi:hypothetical protein